MWEKQWEKQWSSRWEPGRWGGSWRVKAAGLCCAAQQGERRPGSWRNSELLENLGVHKKWKCFRRVDKGLGTWPGWSEARKRWHRCLNKRKHRPEKFSKWYLLRKSISWGWRSCRSAGTSWSWVNLERISFAHLPKIQAERNCSERGPKIKV